MNNINRIIFTTYLTFTLMIILFHTFYGIEDPALYLKFGVRIAMLLTAVAVDKKYFEQKIVALAFFFTIASDFFFVLIRATNPDLVNRELYGMIGFIVAYLFLIAAFQRNFRIGKAELLTAAPFLIIFGIVLKSLKQYATGFFFVAAIVLGIVLCYAAMTMVSTLYRGYFRRNIAQMIAAAGCILFLSDMVVAFSIFHPDFRGFILWKENLIWGTYMLGWILLLMITAGDKMRESEKKERSQF